MVLNSTTLKECLSNASRIKVDESLGPKTTLRVGGHADLFLQAASRDDLIAALRWSRLHGVPVTMLGRGSNLLILDGGIRGLVISLSDRFFSRIEVQDERLTCGAGARLKQLAETSRMAGLSGLEFLEGIPGCVGGALHMNAGAMQQWTFDRVEKITTMDREGDLHVWKGSEVEVHYRSCPLLREHIAIEAVFLGTQSNPSVIRKTMDNYSRRRRLSQPVASSAGCMFKNPDHISAGKLIDELGLKGTRVGEAMISELHGNFIVNLGGAVAADVVSLINLVQERVMSAHQIELEVEVQVVGE